jgi:hypothetical protein
MWAEDGVLPGAPKRSFVKMLSSPLQCHEVFGFGDQSPVCRLRRGRLGLDFGGERLADATARV